MERSERRLAAIREYDVEDVTGEVYYAIKVYVCVREAAVDVGLWVASVDNMVAVFVIGDMVEIERMAGTEQVKADGQNRDRRDHCQQGADLESPRERAGEHLQPPQDRQESAGATPEHCGRGRRHRRSRFTVSV